MGCEERKQAELDRLYGIRDSLIEQGPGHTTVDYDATMRRINERIAVVQSWVCDDKAPKPSTTPVRHEGLLSCIFFLLIGVPILCGVLAPEFFGSVLSFGGTIVGGILNLLQWLISGDGFVLLVIAGSIVVVVVILAVVISSVRGILNRLRK